MVFFFTPPSGRGLVIPILFPWFFTSPSGRGLVIPFFFLWFFFWWSLAPDLRSVKTILAVIFVRLEFIRQNFHDSCVESYWRFNDIKTPSMKATTKVLASFEAGMNLPDLPWHVNITSLIHRSRFGEVPCFRQVEQFNSQMQAFFWKFCFASPKSLRKVA